MQYSLSYDTKIFEEHDNNDGSIGNQLIITLSGPKFTGDLGPFDGAKYTASNVPAGLTLSITKNADTQLAVSLTGNAEMTLYCKNIFYESDKNTVNIFNKGSKTKNFNYKRRDLQNFKSFTSEDRLC